MVKKGRKYSQHLLLLLGLASAPLLAGGCSTTQSKIDPPRLTPKQEAAYKMVEVPPTKKVVLEELPEEVLEPTVLYPPKDVAELKLLDKKITLSVFNVTLNEVLKAIAKVSNFDVIYEDGVDKEKKISFQVKERSLKEILDLISRMTGYYYEVKDRTVFIKSLKTKYYDVGVPKIIADNTIELEGDLATANLTGTTGVGTTGVGTTGTAGTGTGTGTNDITLKYDNLKNENPYKRLQEMLDKIISEKGKYVIDEDTGILIVTDTVNNLKRVDTLVHKFKYFYSKQVDVEITLIEVVYGKGETKYINWSALLPKVMHGTTLSYAPVGNITMGGLIIQGTGTQGEYFRITNAILSFLRNYGNTQIVASPRLRLTNGYSAMVIAGSIQPYWKKEEQFLTTGYVPAGTTGTIDTEITKVTKWIERDYLQGVMLNVKARVNDRNEIYLLVTPMLTDIVGEKQTTDGQVSAPITVTRQATTLLKVHDGDIVVLGGLRGKKLQHNIEGIPGFMENKLTGTVSSNRVFGYEETELVMIIRAKLVY